MDGIERDRHPLSKKDIIGKYQSEIESVREENRHIESQAGLFLRIWLAFLGLFLTAGIAGGSSWIDYLSTTMNTVSPEIPDQSETVFLFNEIGSYFASRLILTVSSLAFMASIIFLFFLPPYSALKSIQTQELEYNLEETVVKDMDEVTKEDIIEEYEDNLEKSSDRLNNTIENWESCVSSLFWGMRLLVGGSITLFLILFSYNIFSMSVGLVFVSLVSLWTYNGHKEKIRDYYTAENAIDITYIASFSIVSIGFILDEMFRAGSWLILLAMAGPMIMVALIRDFSLSTNLRYMIKSASYFATTFLVTISYEEFIYNYSFDKSVNFHELIYILLTSMFLSAAYLALVMLGIVIGILIKMGGVRVKDRGLEYISQF